MPFCQMASYDRGPWLSVEHGQRGSRKFGVESAIAIQEHDELGFGPMLQRQVEPLVSPTCCRKRSVSRKLDNLGAQAPRNLRASVARSGVRVDGRQADSTHGFQTELKRFALVATDHHGDDSTFTHSHWRSIHAGG